MNILEEIAKGNEEIAKYLGWFKQEGQNSWFVKSDLAIYVAYSLPNYPFNDLPFHRDWKYLMDVVDRINSDGHGNVKILNKYCEISYFQYLNSPLNKTLNAYGSESVDTSIEYVWEAVQKYCEYYNKQNFI